LLLGNGFDHQTVNGFLGINMGLVYSPRRCISVDIVYLRSWRRVSGREMIEKGESRKRWRNSDVGPVESL
jgi:hypothetical protein